MTPDHWHWPQYVAVGSYVLALLIGALLDGEPKTGEHKFGVSAVSVGISAFVLWSGGFFA